MRWKTARRSSNVKDRRGVRIPRKAAGGYVTPDSFTHGSSRQRMRWFKRGFETGDIRDCNTFRANL